MTYCEGGWTYKHFGKPKIVERSILVYINQLIMAKNQLNCDN